MKFLINKFIFRYKDVLICSDEGDNIFVLFHILTSEKVDPAYAPSDESISQGWVVPVTTRNSYELIMDYFVKEWADKHYIEQDYENSN